MYMSKCMYMSECKIFPFFTFRYPNTTPTVYNWSEKNPIESFCYSLTFMEIDGLKGSS